MVSGLKVLIVTSLKFFLNGRYLSPPRYVESLRFLGVVSTQGSIGDLSFSFPTGYLHIVKQRQACQEKERHKASGKYWEEQMAAVINFPAD
jgi:hypothetical protein